jgi:DNA polymerase III delta prime subunit
VEGRQSPAVDGPKRGTSVSASDIRLRTEPGERIYDAAIRGLSEEDQATIGSLMTENTVDDIKRAQDAIRAHEHKCDEENWKIVIQGHTLRLSDVAKSLSLLLDKLQPGIDLVGQAVELIKPGIDVATSLDPIHIGVPVALIKAILQVATFFSDQMERLLAGLSTATFMLKQLSLYFEYFKFVDGAAVANNLEEVLVSSYTTVFEFLAIGHRALRENGVKRAWELLWSQDIVKGFDESCTAASDKLEMAANHCNRDGSRKDLAQVKEQIGSILGQMKQLDVVAMTIEALNIKVDLSRLQSAGSAAYDCSSKDGTLYEYCLQGTRKKLIEDITQWCHESHERIFLISGMAGTGKSTLIRTVARQINKEGLLAASFFFRQDLEFHRDGSRFVASLVNQLLTRHPTLRPFVAAALDADRDLPGGSFQNQFTKLLKEPLMQAGLRKLVLVIDALDECRTDDVKRILAQLDELAQEIDIRVIVTSRPEKAIEDLFSNIPADKQRLELIREEETEADIRQFLVTCFQALAEADAKQAFPQLEAGWPAPGTIDELVQLTIPLFIFAATVFRYVQDADDPVRCLADLLEENRSTSLQGMQQVYLPILRQVYRGVEDEVITRFKAVVGTIILVQNPFSIQSLGRLLDIKPGVVERFLKPLRSVLRIPDDPNLPVSILHKSFKDFLLDLPHEFQIDSRLTNRSILEQCLRIMNEQLHQDMCRTKEPGSKRGDVQSVGDHIMPELAYACQYWISHIEESSGMNEVHYYEFLQSKFLYWLETLSWLGSISSAVAHLTKLKTCVQVSQHSTTRCHITD